jgi:hypothetical protein
MNAPSISPRRRRDIIDALRRGTVPQRGLDVMAVGLGRFEGAIDEELGAVGDGGAHFKAVRGEYGSGKTFFSRWLIERAQKASFATAEIQISETETPLHKLETVYRRITESLATSESLSGAFGDVIDNWFHVLQSDAEAAGVDPQDVEMVERATSDLLEQRLASVTDNAPAFAAALRGYRHAALHNDRSQADGLLAWLGGQPHVAASIRRAAGIRGELDHFGALGFLQGLLTVLRDSDYRGLVVVLDEVETLQRVRSDVREKSLNALRQLADEIDGGRFPGLYLVMTGTPAFFDGPQGVKRLPPLAQRLDVDFSMDPRYDNPRAPQIRLGGFSHDSLLELGSRVRDIFVQGISDSDRVRRVVDDRYIAGLADAIAGDLGGKVGVAPRLFLKKLIDVLDRVELHIEFDPRRDYHLKVARDELTDVERAATMLGDVRGARSVDDIDLDL